MKTPSFSKSVQVRADLGDTSAWLKFNPKTWTLSGQAPLTLSLEVVNVSISFENATMAATGMVTLHLILGRETPTVTTTNTKGTRAVPGASETSKSTDAAMST